MSLLIFGIISILIFVFLLGNVDSNGSNKFNSSKDLFKFTLIGLLLLFSIGWVLADIISFINL